MFLAVFTAIFMLGGLWFIFRVFRKVKSRSGWIKESEIFADKKFVDYLSEENLGNVNVLEVEKKSKSGANRNIEIGDDVGNFNESEVLKLAKKYGVEQGEVELLLNIRSKSRKNGGYDKILSEVEKGVDIKKVAKKYKVGCGELQLLLTFKNINQSSLWKYDKRNLYIRGWNDAK